MRIEYQIMLSLLLDFILGDPRFVLHPVRLIGAVALKLEPLFRQLPFSLRVNGTLVALSVIALTGGLAFALIRAANQLHPLMGDLVSVLLIYFAIAARDLERHSTAVFKALMQGKLDNARRALAMIVGRDTSALDTQGISRAAVESVAESIVDGITAPIFFACLFGPVGAMAYKAINTLDSTFGYKNERYRYFGWASARIDDMANFIPARLTALVMPLAAAILGKSPLRTFKIILRDHAKHESPNAAFSEAAMAGALGVRLGGLSYYQGEPLEKPFIGDVVVELEPAHIKKANHVMYLTTLLFTLGCVALSLIVRGL